jgi:hypothetical protein
MFMYLYCFSVYVILIIFVILKLYIYTHTHKHVYTHTYMHICIFLHIHKLVPILAAFEPSNHVLYAEYYVTYILIQFHYKLVNIQYMYIKHIDLQSMY